MPQPYQPWKRGNLSYLRYLGRMSRGSQPELQLLDYSRGINSYAANDVVPNNQLVYATDARISTLGRYITKQGADHYSVALGETVANQNAGAGSGDVTISPTQWVATKFTASATGRMSSASLAVKNTSSGTGEVIVTIYADNAGTPGTILAQSSIPASSLTNAYVFLTAYFIEAPTITTGTVYWIGANVQDNGSNNYFVRQVASPSAASTSTNSGVTWSTQAFDIGYKTFIATNSPTLGLYRAVKSDGTHTTLLAHGTNLYTINDGTGATASIKSGLNASATSYRFALANNVVYYVNGQDTPRKWDFTTEAVNPASPNISSNIIMFKNQMFYMDSANPTRIFWSDLGSFETFTSTNFIYVPSPFAPDPLTAWANLNDNLFIFSKGTKYVLQGSDISNFSLRRSTGLKGAPSQEAITTTRNAIFFMSNDGVYEFNGSTDTLISGAVTDKINQIADYTKCVLHVNRNRLYVFYPDSGQPGSNKCLVYNLDWKAWESLDLNMYVNRAISWTQDSGQFVLGSSLVGAAYYNELSSNSYNNLGKPLTWELRTRYEHFNAPSSQKDIRQWYPRFLTSAGNYTVFCQYDKDFAGSPTSQFNFLRGAGSIWGGGGTWGSGLVWGSSSIVSTALEIDGLANYWQFRYQRPGVNMPVEFAGHTFLYKMKTPL